MRKSVLVVEDDDKQANLLAGTIRDFGHDAAVATEGLYAVELAARVKPQIVFVDIMLPGLSGWEVCKRIRAMPDGRNAQIFALTALANEDQKRESIQAGFDAHLVKPLGGEFLRSLLGHA